jgi:predicted metalloprotease with PDZ domain
MRSLLTFALTFTAASVAGAQHPLRHFVDAVDMRFSRSQPVIDYTLRVDSAGQTGWSVEMHIRSAPDSFQLTMARHPEYDDRYSRYVEAVTITGARGTPSIVRTDSALWTVRGSGGESTVRYRIQLPAPERPRRAAWRPFLTPTGGLTGGPHAFMYVIGSTLAPSHVKVHAPSSWKIVTALTPTIDSTVFFAPSVDALVESPIFVGRVHDWSYRVDGVPHRVVYWSLPEGTPFDSTAFVGALERFSQQAVALFGRAPYRDYTFVFQDGAYGGLEHPASVTLGALSEDMAKNPFAPIEEAAHEYFHTWNLMRVRPAEYAGVSNRAPVPSAGLWFSEGLTIYYADALMRRAGIPGSYPTRDAHLRTLLERYLENSGTAKYSAEQVSRVAYNAGPLALGDYSVSTHMQGEVIGTMLDFIIRDATNGARSMDDVMRLMLERHSGETGFVGRDIERAVSDVCRCSVKSFFDAHVRGGSRIDVGRYVRLAGFQLEISREPAARDGVALADMRVFGYNPEGEAGMRLRLIEPTSAWGRAGLHTGDRVVSMNGAAVSTWPAMRSILSALRIGDTLAVVVNRPSGQVATRVAIMGYDRPTVRLTPLDRASPTQKSIRERWLQGR